MDNNIATKILNISRNNLLIDFKLLTKAFYALEFRNNSFFVGTDGQYFYYENRNVLEKYLLDRNNLTKIFFHSVIHCILKHPFIFEGANFIENIACDIIVESIIIDLQKTKPSFIEEENKVTIINEIKDNVNSFVPINVIEYLGALNENTIKHYQSIFKVDDHDFWTNNSSSSGTNQNEGDEIEDNNKQNINEGSNNLNNEKKDRENNDKKSHPDSKCQDLSNRWQDIAEELTMDLENFSISQGVLSGDLINNLSNLKREEEDYSTFLKQFAVMGELMKSNPDEFDIIYYTYGLNLYKNVALVEPLEYRDEKRIKDFVIAVDTSGSVYGQLVESFLQKTYNILMNEESFHTKINIHIIQCDADIQKIDVIKNKTEIDEYIKTLRIHGLGGTDFRPVFNYVDRKILEGEFKNFEGIIYFTDGHGIFPAYRPRYKSAFIFMENPSIPQVPPWAIKHVIKTKELI